MDPTDDAWSYSYPSSLDSLPLPPDTSSTNQAVIASEAIEEEKSDKKDESKKSMVTEQPKGIILESPIAIHRNSRLSVSNETDSSTSKPIPVPQPALLPRQRNTPNLSPGKLNKSAPADPHTTKHDAEAFPGDNSSVSSVNDPAADLAMIQNQSPPSTPTQSGNFFNTMFSNISFSKKGQNGKPDDLNTNVDENGNIVLTMGTHSRTNSNATSVRESPGMLSYRRNKKSRRRNTSASSIDSIKSPLVEGEKPILPTQKENVIDEDDYDKNHYVNEKFKNTSYRFAVESRNKDFHKLFKSVTEDERLLDDFSCALSREILLQGRLYISEKNICFNSNLLGWVTNLVIPYADIRSFEKTATAGLFPNGISIQLTNGNKHYFASFLSRDSTYNMLTEIWEASDDQANTLASINTNSFLSTEGEPLVSKDLSLDLEKYDNDEYQNALLSIDGDTPGARRQSISESDSFSDESSSSGYNGDSNSESGKVISTSEQIVYKIKNTSVYAYNGPEGHQKTSSGYDYEQNKEIILAQENFKCPPGLLFEIIFGPNNDLTLQFLGAQGSSDFSKFSDYERNQDGKKQRSYDYTKTLGYSIGPKSAKCFVEEIVENLDYSGYINVLSITKTPNVPSGNAFSVQTRYIMAWGENNTTDLVISFKVDWTGSSWVKSMIDKSCLSGQEEATKVLIPLLQKTVQENTSEAKEEVTMEDNVEPLAAAKLQKTETEAKSVNPAAVSSSTSFIDQLSSISWINLTFLGLLLAILLVQISIFRSFKSLTSTIGSFGLLSDIDQNTGQALFKGEELLLWNWIDERAGKLDLSKNEKIGVIKNDIDQLINKWVNNDMKSKETGELVKSLEFHLNSYTHDALNNANEERHQEKAAALRAAIKALI